MNAIVGRVEVPARFERDSRGAKVTLGDRAKPRGRVRRVRAGGAPLDPRVRDPVGLQRMVVREPRVEDSGQGPDAVENLRMEQREPDGIPGDGAFRRELRDQGPLGAEAGIDALRDF